MKKYYALGCIQLALLCTIVSCQKSTSIHVHKELKQCLSQAFSINYKYTIEQENRFNESSLSDSAVVHYYRIEEGHHGFALHISSYEEDFIYDGLNFEKVRHLDSTIVVYNTEEISENPDYFSDLFYFSTNPLMINDYDNFESVRDSVIGGQSYFIYCNETQQKSHTDSTKTVLYQKQFYVDADSKNLNQIRDLIIRSGETLQVVKHHFEDISFNTSSMDLLTLDDKVRQTFDTVSEEEDNETFTYTPIKEGAALSTKTYKDVDQKDVDIFGDAQKSTLIMFSFIGCAPCEEALKDFRNERYQFSDDINLYYSSFQNPASTLKKYLKKKEFPNTAFGKESNLIAEFSLYHSPAFALIDSDGKILKVMEGYDDEVKENLFNILKPD